MLSVGLGLAVGRGGPSTAVDELVDVVLSRLAERLDLAVDTVDCVAGGLGNVLLGGAVLGVGLVRTEVALDEEAHEQTGQWGEVDEVEVDGKGLAARIDARDVFVLRAVNGSSLSSMLNRVLSVLFSSKVSMGRRGSIGSKDILRKTLVTSGAVDPLLQESEAGTGGGGDSGGSDRRRDRSNGRGVELGDNLLGNFVGDGDRDGVRYEQMSSGEGNTDDELGDLHGGESALDALGHTESESGNGVVRVLETS